MQPTLCSRCKKNVAVVFISKLDGEKTVNEGLCLKCAKELGLPLSLIHILVSEFKSSERFVTDACVVDGKHLAAVTLGQEAGTFVSNIVLYNLEKAGEVEPAADYDVEDGLVAAIAEQDGRILTCLLYTSLL